MNTLENSQENQNIKVKDLLEDIRSGMNDEDLSNKHNVTRAVLEKLGDMVLELNAELYRTIEGREQYVALAEKSLQNPDTETSSFICPSCLTSYNTMFDICPNCSVSMQEIIARENQRSCTDVESIVGNYSAALEEKILQNQFNENIESRPSEKTSPDSGKGPVKESAVPFQRDTKIKKINRADKTRAARHKIVQPADRTVQRTPWEDQIDGPRGEPGLPAVRCESCKGRMAPALRDIYDRSRSLQSLAFAASCFLLGFLGSVALSWFDGPSLGRLTVFFITGVLLLLGAALTFVGVFTYFAREKVYFCARCKRTCPRADISYLAAALSWSSKKTIRGFG